MPVKITRTEYSADDLRREAARARDPAAARRMLAIAMLLEGASRADAARLCGMDRQTLRDWVHRYNEAGLEGLYNRTSPGRQRALSPEQEAELAGLVRKGPDPDRDGVVRWRRVDLQKVIKERYDIEMHERSVGKVLHRLRFAKVSARPRHPQADPEAQEAFKKTFPIW